MVIYLENPNESTRKLLECLSEFSRIIGHIVNVQNKTLEKNIGERRYFR